MTGADMCFTLFLDLHSSARPAFVKFVEDIAFGMSPHGCRVRLSAYGACAIDEEPKLLLGRYVTTGDELRHQWHSFAKAPISVPIKRLDATLTAIFKTDGAESIARRVGFLVSSDNWEYSTRARTAYSALVRRKAVCEGYAMAYRLLLNAVGIVSDVSIDRSGKHIWNYVRIHGRWYHVDVTWDDPVYAGPVQCRRRISHRHFLMSDRKARKTGHKRWDVRGLPPADDERFDSQYY